MYKEKYLKYKSKYLDLKSQLGGSDNLLIVHYTSSNDIAREIEQLIEHSKTKEIDLVLTSHVITDSGLQIIIDNIASLNIKKLRIYDTNIDNAITNIVKIMQSPRLRLRELSFKKCVSFQWTEIIYGLKHNTTLTHLDLSESNFGKNEDVLVLTNALKYNLNMLTHLDLRETNFYKDENNVLAIADALKYNTFLTYLDLSAKIRLAIFTEGAVYIELAKALKNQNTLKTLKIEHLKLNNNVYNAFILHAPMLEKLYFNYNSTTGLPSASFRVDRPDISDTNYIMVYNLF